MSGEAPPIRRALLCLHCGYDCGAHDGRTCPECGRLHSVARPPFAGRIGWKAQVAGVGLVAMSFASSDPLNDRDAVEAVTLLLIVASLGYWAFRLRKTMRYRRQWLADDRHWWLHYLLAFDLCFVALVLTVADPVGRMRWMQLEYELSVAGQQLAAGPDATISGGLSAGGVTVREAVVKNGQVVFVLDRFGGLFYDRARAIVRSPGGPPTVQYPRVDFRRFRGDWYLGWELWD